MKRALTDIQAREVRDKHQAGMWVSDLCREYGITEGAIKQILLGITYKFAGGQIGIIKHARKKPTEYMRVLKLSQAQRDEVRALAASGVSQADLHRQYGVSRAYISRVVNGTR